MTFRFDFRPYALPFRAPVHTAHGVWTKREGLLVRLTDAAGRTGFGEAAPIPWFGTETIAEAVEIARELGPDVDEARLENVPARARCLRGALQEARAMLREKVSRETAPPAAPPGAKHLSVAALLPAGRAVLTAAAPKAEAGFRVFKWKVGVGDPADELGLLADLLAALPEGAKVRLDANGAWDRRRAERWLARCAEWPVEFIEQPIAADARGADDLLRGLAGDFPTPLALDESVMNAADVERWLGAGWPGFFVIKPTLLDDADAVLARLEKARARVVFSSALETALGARAALRRAFAFGGEPRALGFGVWPLFEDARFDGPHAAPFLHREDMERINPEAVWNALS